MAGELAGRFLRRRADRLPRSHLPRPHGDAHPGYEPAAADCNGIPRQLFILYPARCSLSGISRWAAYKDQQQEIRRVKQDILQTRMQAERTEWQASSARRGGGIMKLKGYKDYQRSIAKKVARKAKARSQKLERYLDAEERVERPKQSRNIRLDFAESVHLGRSVLALQDLSVGYDVNCPLLSTLQLYVSAGERIILTGPNGSGKSTLLRTIVGELEPLDGRVDRGPSVVLGTMTQEQTGLDPNLSPVETVQHAFGNETAARTFLAYFLVYRRGATAPYQPVELRPARAAGPGAVDHRRLQCLAP